MMPNKLIQFWQDLKRRNVVRVIMVYAGAAFVILELVDMIREPFELPNWSFKLVVVLLSVGLIIAVILSWIYDIHPEDGLVKTEPAHKIKPGDIPKSSNRWKIASYISFLVIVGLIVLNVIPRSGNNKILEKSIAILPVRNLGGDPDQDPMCAGLTSEIISQLAKIKSFDKVVPFQSVMNIDSDQNVLDISEEFGVNYILETNYLKVGDQFRLNFLLNEPREEKIIWQDDYERKYEQIISINTEIALEIARKLNTYISEEEKERIENVPTTQNLEAYELLQSAAYELVPKFNFKYAYKDTLQKVIDLDPTYADAWAFMATLSIFQSIGVQVPGFNAMDAIEYNQKAWALDPENLSVLLNQAVIEAWWHWDYIAAEANFRKAFTIAPNTSHYWLIRGYIEFLVSMKRYEEIPPYFSRLGEHDEWEMDVYAALGQQDKAEAAVQRMIDEGRYWQVLRFYIWRGEYERASALVNAFSLENNWGPHIANLAIVRNKTGDISGAEDLIQELKERSEIYTGGRAEFNLARYYSVAGEPDSAFTYLYQAYDEKYFEMGWLKGDPTFDYIREDDRYRNLYAKVGLQDYDDYRASRKEQN